MESLQPVVRTQSGLLSRFNALRSVAPVTNHGASSSQIEISGVTSIETYQIFDHDEQSAIVKHAATARKAYKPPTG